jgi:hypothetical protein
LAMLGCAILLLNLFWIVPTILLFGQTYAPASTGDYLKDFGPSASGMPVGLALATMHGFWRGGFTYTKDIFPLWPLIFLAIFALAVWGFLALLKDRTLYALSLLAIFIIALVLGLGPNSPVLWIFDLTGISNLFYMAFRDSQKFVGLLCLAYSILGSYGAFEILKASGRFRVLAFALVFLIPIAYNFGFFGLLGQMWPTNYPRDWAQAERVMASDSVDGKLLFLPAHLYNMYPWVGSSQKTLAAPASQYFSRSVVCERNIIMPNVYSDMNDPQGAYIRYLFSNRQWINDTAEFLMPLGVRYIIIFKGSEDADSYLWLFQRRGGVRNITLAYESEDLYLFRNDLVRGAFFSSDDPGTGDLESLRASTGKGMSVSDVSYDEVTPAAYNIDGYGSEFLIIPSPAPGALRLGGAAPSSWHGIASVYPKGEVGTLQNPIFPLILALFLISWAVAAWLVSGFPPLMLAIPLLLGIPIFFLVLSGSLLPVHLGILLIFSAFSVGVSKTGFFESITQRFLKPK